MAEPHVGGVVPHLTVTGGAVAVAFYRDAFGAEEFVRRYADDGERIVRSHLGINGGSIILSDDFPERHGEVGAPPPARVALHLQVDDANAWCLRACEAGCTVILPLADQPWGERYGELKDPFGHIWAIAQAVA